MFIYISNFQRLLNKATSESQIAGIHKDCHCAKKPVTTMLTYPWKCTVLHCNHLGNTWKPLVPMTRHFDYCPSASEGDNQSVGSSAPVVSRCFPGGYNVKLYISRGRLAWWLLAFLHRLHSFLEIVCDSYITLVCVTRDIVINDICIHMKEGYYMWAGVNVTGALVGEVEIQMHETRSLVFYGIQNRK